VSAELVHAHDIYPRAAIQSAIFIDLLTTQAYEKQK
jgi:hypothetical protein